MLRILGFFRVLLVIGIPLLVWWLLLWLGDLSRLVLVHVGDVSGTRDTRKVWGSPFVLTQKLFPIRLTL